MAWKYDPIEGEYWEDDPVFPGNVDIDQYEDGTYRSPVDQQGGYGEPIVAGAPPNSEWNPTSGNWDDVPSQPPQPNPNPNPPPNPNPNPNPTTTLGTTNPGTRQFSGSFTAPSRQAYPALPTVPNAPTPNLPTWAAPPAFSYDPYTAPAPFAPETFRAPSVDQMLVDPSYQWRKGQGEDSLQRWAAARGTLNDSGTAKALLEYGGNAASQEYGNIWNRDYNAFNTNEGNRFNAYNVNEGNRAATYDRNRAGAVDTYNTNYQTQYVDPYKAAYQTGIDTWIPQQEQWRAGVDMSRLGYSTQTGVIQHDNDMQYQNAWDQFLNGRRMWENDRDFGLKLATI